jgi:hypothetical protein
LWKGGIPECVFGGVILPDTKLARFLGCCGALIATEERLDAMGATKP